MTNGMFITKADVDLYARYKDGRIDSIDELRQLLALGSRFHKATGAYGRWVNDLAAALYGCDE